MNDLDLTPGWWWLQMEDAEADGPVWEVGVVCGGPEPYWVPRNQGWRAVHLKGLHILKAVPVLNPAELAESLVDPLKDALLLVQEQKAFIHRLLTALEALAPGTTSPPPTPPSPETP